MPGEGGPLDGHVALAAQQNGRDVDIRPQATFSARPSGGSAQVTFPSDHSDHSDHSAPANRIPVALRDGLAVTVHAQRAELVAGE